MTTVAAKQTSSRLFGLVVFAFMAVSLILTATLPVAMAIGIVFLFAGPHNYCEARYFLTRLPGRAGRLAPFFLLSAAGIVLLSFSLPLIGHAPRWLEMNGASAMGIVATWNAALIGWCGILITMRSRQPPRRNWDLTWPIALAVFSVSLLQPFLLPLLLVFIHPLMGLWILDRELIKSRPSWSGSFRSCLTLLPVFLLSLWLWPSGQQEIGFIDVPPSLRSQVVSHAGGSLLTFLDVNKLVATHAFLELLHYGVWILAIPVASGRAFSNEFKRIPLMKRSPGARLLLTCLVTAAAAVVFVLWVGFAIDYELTRRIYFTVATVHVLAEVPFLLRIL